MPRANNCLVCLVVKVNSFFGYFGSANKRPRVALLSRTTYQDEMLLDDRSHKVQHFFNETFEYIHRWPQPLHEFPSSPSSLVALRHAVAARVPGGPGVRHWNKKMIKIIKRRRHWVSLAASTEEKR